MNDVLDPAPLLICESLVAGLEALDVSAVVTILCLVIDSHGFDHAADDGAFGALDGRFNVAGGCAAKVSTCWQVSSTRQVALRSMCNEGGYRSCRSSSR